MASPHGPELQRITTRRNVIEISIYETGAPPRFRLTGLKDVSLTVETVREKGELQVFAMQDKGDYWESVDAIPEPHQFKVNIVVTHDGHSHTHQTQFIEHTHSHGGSGGHDHPHEQGTAQQKAQPQGVHDHPHPHPHEADAVAHAQQHGPETTERAHGHDHGEHGHDHAPKGLFGRILGTIFHTHSHGAGPAVGDTVWSTGRGIWAVKVSLLGLGVTALFQVVVVLISGSVALLADTVHNFADALTAIPLWIAFSLARRAATRRYTYGYGRIEDLAGLFVLLMITASAVIAAWESVHRLLNPRPIENIGWVMAAAIIGFLGNEGVAVLRIRVGKQIGSAALVADGYHARTDGLTSLAVLFGALGVLAGFELADPIVGLLISVLILFVLRDAVRQMWPRLVDAADPALVDRLEREAAAVKGVRRVEGLRVRWIGHRMDADLRVVVDENLSTRESHAIAEAVRHALFHEEPKLENVVVHVDPHGKGSDDHHAITSHHERRKGGPTSAQRA